MATKEELYVSFSPEDYREGKSNVLMAQAELLGTLKRLHKLKVLARQRIDLKKRLHRLFASTISEIDSIQEKVPTPKIPKTVQHTEEPEIKKETFSKRDDIEDELVLINQKIRELNS
jgi:hypothetical protein